MVNLSSSPMSKDCVDSSARIRFAMWIRFLVDTSACDVNASVNSGSAVMTISTCGLNLRITRPISAQQAQQVDVTSLLIDSLFSSHFRFYLDFTRPAVPWSCAWCISIQVIFRCPPRSSGVQESNMILIPSRSAHAPMTWFVQTSSWWTRRKWNIGKERKQWKSHQKISRFSTSK